MTNPSQPTVPSPDVKVVTAQVVYEPRLVGEIPAQKNFMDSAFGQVLIGVVGGVIVANLVK